MSVAEVDALSWLEKRLLLDEWNFEVEDHNRANKKHPLPPLTDAEREARTPREARSEARAGTASGTSSEGAFAGMSTDEFMAAVGAYTKGEG